MARPSPSLARVRFILATIGSAVGLGSIWKFPYEVGENGGGGFVLFYVLGLLLVVTPLMLAELALGRRGGADAPASLARLARGAGRSPLWGLAGWLAVLTGTVILGYYAVMAGLTLAYLVHALGSGFAGIDAAGTRALFAATVADPWGLMLWQGLFLAACVAVVARGFERGIEAACRVLMPLLAVLMLGLAAYAAIEGALGQALKFLFAPRLEGLSARAALEALGLGFFSIGVGLGVLLTYAAHAEPGERMGTVATATILGDTAISVLAGLAIFPLVFAHGLDPAAGTGLMFLTLPIAFGRLPGGDLVAAGFFLALCAAALASAVALLELAVAPAIRRLGLSRPMAALLVGLVVGLAGLPTVLSFNDWQAVRLLGFVPGFETADLFEVADRIASNLLLPASGLLLSLFAGWAVPRALLEEEIGLSPRRAGLLQALLRWLVPALILGFVVMGHA